jgi:tetratricopeptide (TPR) repeat protein
MNFFIRLVATCMLLGVLPLLAQTSKLNTDAQPPHRIAAPSPALSAHDLETEGDSLRAQKEYLDAIDYYRCALPKGETATLHNKTGVAFLQLSRYREARREFERAIRMDKNYAEAHNNLGVTFYQDLHYGSAIREYHKAIKINSSVASFHSNLGAAYFANKDFTGSMKEYIRAQQLDPTIFDHEASGGVSAKLATPGDRAHFHYVIAKMYGRSGDSERCRLYLSKANEEGYPHVKDALKDTEFAELRKDPNFVVFVRSLKTPNMDSTE